MPLKAARFDVAISGASFAGLALASALSDALGSEFKIAVIDRLPPTAVRPDARAFALSAASRHLLEAIGVWPAIAAEAQPVDGIDITDSSLAAGVRPVLLAYDNVTAAGEPATHIVPVGPLTAALRAKVEGCPSITMLAPAEATGFTVGETGAHVPLADGRELIASLLVAADGRKSALREAAGIKVIGWSYPQTGIVTTVRHERPHAARAVQHFLPAGPFAILPLIGDRACITWTEDAGEARRIMALDDAWFLAEVETRFGGKLGDHRTRRTAPVLATGAASGAPLRGPALCSPRRCGARRAPAGWPRAQSRFPRCRRAGGSRGRKRAPRL